MFFSIHFRQILILLLFTAITVSVNSQTVAESRTYIEKHKKIATALSERFGIPASVILAQAMFESGCGKSELAQRSNNHFGIKCHRGWAGDTVTKTDDAHNECFRKYRLVEQSFVDHSIFIKSRKRYAHLFQLPLTDYEGWCKGLKDAGYATFPAYAEELIRLIETYELYTLDACLPLPSNSICAALPRDLQQSHVPREYISLKRMAETDLLFSEEHDFVLRSFLVMTGDKSTQREMARR